MRKRKAAFRRPFGFEVIGSVLDSRMVLPPTVTSNDCPSRTHGLTVSTDSAVVFKPERRPNIREEDTAP